jgi:LmbE family N-acetylglucosaminyl deacetylase
VQLDPPRSVSGMFIAASRIRFFALHPDDESLAGGGLLQKVAAAGATIQVVFVTNGENNAWPHRVLQRQWRINEADRAHWGMR